MAKKIIQIIKGKEYQARRDDIYKKDIFFADTYAAARDFIYDIVDISEEVKKELIRESRSKKWSDFIAQLSENPNQDLRGQVNNIIAFCADRGQGKTTAMRSFSRELENCTGLSQTQRCPRRFPECQGPTQGCPGYSDFWTKGCLPPMHFIECIDPTMMSKSDTIIKVILSRMFNRVSQMEKERDKENARIGDFGGHRVNLRDQEKLLDQFQKCFHDAEILSGETRHEDWRAEDDLEKMAELGDSSHLLVSMCRLIHLYLDYMGTGEGYLVIRIDDADMQISKTFEILDDIRRYLLLPNVIILIAANMTQLESTVEQHFLEEYKTSVNTPGSMGNVEYCHNVATLFLEKILPSSRRIFLPRLEEHWEELFVEYLGPQDNNLLPEGNADWRIEKQLLNYLHKKTGMVFLKPQNRYHDFLPANIRELTHFLAYFARMEDLKDCYNTVLHIFASKNYDKENLPGVISCWEKNLNIFQDYLIHLWSVTNLRESGRKLFTRFAEESLFNKHDFLLRSLPDYYSQERVADGKLQGVETKSRDEYYDEFLEECKKRGIEISESENNKKRRISSSSYADVMTALSVLEEMPSSSRQTKFVYAVRLFYSICLHQIMLRRLRHLDEAPVPDQILTYFMRDGFVKDELIDFSFCQILIPSYPSFPFYKICFKKEISQNLEDYRTPSISNLFVRRKVSNGLSVWTRPAEKEDEWYNIYPEEYNSEGFVFHPFYGLLYELDKFTYTNKNFFEGEIVRFDASELRMQLAFIVSLNWDVQHNLFSFHWPLRIGFDTNLCDLITSLYSDVRVEKLLYEIEELNRDIHWKDSNEYDSFLVTFMGEIDDSFMDRSDVKDFGNNLGKYFWEQGSSQNSEPIQIPGTAPTAPAPEMPNMEKLIATMVHSIFEEIRKTTAKNDDTPSTAPSQEK